MPESLQRSSSMLGFSVFQVFGGVAMIITGFGVFVPMRPPLPVITAICWVVAGVALIIGR